MNFKKSILILALFFFATMQSQTMVTTNIQSRLLNKYWCPNVGDPYEVVFLFEQRYVTLFVGNKKIGSEPYYITTNTEVTTPTTFNTLKLGTTSSGNCIKTNSSYYIVEFSSDFKSFRWKRSFDPAQIWQTYTVKSTPFFSIAKSGTFTRNNCGTGNVGGDWLYDVEAGQYISYVSQADADAKAQADVTTNGQNYVNGEGYCTYYNLATTREIRKNNCPSGKVGSLVSYTVPARTEMSQVSEADLAKNLDTHFNQWGPGQIYANAQGTCGYTNKEMTDYFSKQNCELGKVVYDKTYFRVPANKYFSAVSQDEADRLARADLNLNGQINANNIGECAFENISVSGSFTRNNCVTGIGSNVIYTVAAKQYKSRLSQAYANALAMSELNEQGQNYANYYGTCTYKNTAISRVFIKAGCIAPKTGTSVTYTVVAGKYVSTISQADADGKAQADVTANGQTFANANGTCTFKSTVKTGVYTKAGCIAPTTGTTVTYTVAAGKYESTVSQADADSKAQTDINLNGQTFANTNGKCVFKSIALTNVGFRKVCISPQVGSIVLYSAAVGAFTSTVSQAAADAQAQKAGF
jgi:hypothetical protein